jgi:hypothetical protein
MPIFPQSARLYFVGASILVACTLNAFSQARPSDYVPNLPYRAQLVMTYVETAVDGTRRVQRENLIVARDSQGSTRIEDFHLCQTQRCESNAQVNLYVPLRRQFIQLTPGRKTARVMTFPGTGPIPTKGQGLHAVKTTVEHLAGRAIHGIYAEGTRTTQVIPAADGHRPDIVNVEETWVSPDLKIVVFSKDTSTDPESDQITTEIQQLDRNEPDAALFEIPASYTITETTSGPR